MRALCVDTELSMWYEIGRSTEDVVHAVMLCGKLQFRKTGHVQVAGFLVEEKKRDGEM